MLKRRFPPISSYEHLQPPSARFTCIKMTESARGTLGFILPNRQSSPAVIQLQTVNHAVGGGQRSASPTLHILHTACVMHSADRSLSNRRSFRWCSRKLTWSVDCWINRFWQLTWLIPRADLAKSLLPLKIFGLKLLVELLSLKIYIIVPVDDVPNYSVNHLFVNQTNEKCPSQRSSKKFDKTQTKGFLAFSLLDNWLERDSEQPDGRIFCISAN